MFSAFRIQNKEWVDLPIEKIFELCRSDPKYKNLCNNPSTWRYLLHRDYNIEQPKLPDQLLDREYIGHYKNILKVKYDNNTILLKIFELDKTGEFETKYNEFIDNLVSSRSPSYLQSEIGRAILYEFKLDYLMDLITEIDKIRTVKVDSKLPSFLKQLRTEDVYPDTTMIYPHIDISEIKIPDIMTDKILDFKTFHIPRKFPSYESMLSLMTSKESMTSEKDKKASKLDCIKYTEDSDIDIMEEVY